jgi:hemerythrin-like domain-containing protein
MHAGAGLRLRAAEVRRAMSGSAGPAAREMPIIHRIFRRQFAEVRALVQEARDATRVGALADHLGFLLDGLHMHHATEDDLIWPKLLDRAGLDAPLVKRMEEQHQQIDALVVEVRVAMSAWLSDPTPATSSALTDRIGEFLVLVEEHLDEEERVVVPLIDRYLTEAEWQGVGKRGFEKFTSAQRWIATGQMVEVATPEETAMMFDKLPPPVKVLWHLIGKRKYRRYITSVRGGQLG